MRIGAKGFLLKDVSLERLVWAIRRVMNGENCFRPALTEERALQGVKAMPHAFDSLDMPSPLTRREIEVLALLAGGYSNLEIAQALSTSKGTIKNHVSSNFPSLAFATEFRRYLRGLKSACFENG